MKYSALKQLDRNEHSLIELLYDELQQEKVVKKTYHQESGLQSSLTHEFKILSQLDHPHLMKLLDYGIDPKSGEAYWIGEFYDGQTLRDITGYSFLEKTKIFIQMLQALQYLHHHGLLHGDIKPENIMVLPDGISKLLDFGLAHPTCSSSIGGTIAYASPEQILKNECDGRSDLYSLGITFYEFFSGHHPFPAKDLHDWVGNHLSVKAQPISQLEKGISSDWDPIFKKLLAKNPIDRFQSAGEVIQAINQFSPIPFDTEKITGWQAYAKTKLFRSFGEEKEKLLQTIEKLFLTSPKEPSQIRLERFSQAKEKIFLEQVFFLLKTQNFRTLYLREEISWEESLLHFFEKPISLSSDENLSSISYGFIKDINPKPLIIIYNKSKQIEFLNKLLKKLHTKELNYPVTFIGDEKLDHISKNEIIISFDPLEEFTPPPLQGITDHDLEFYQYFSLSESGFNIQELQKLFQLDTKDILEKVQKGLMENHLNYFQTKVCLANHSLRSALLAKMNNEQICGMATKLLEQLPEHEENSYWEYRYGDHQKGRRKLIEKLDQAAEIFDLKSVHKIIHHLAKDENIQALERKVHYHALFGDYAMGILSAKKLSEKNPSEEILEENHRRLGWLYQKTGKESSSIKEYQKALHIAEQLDLDAEIASVKNELGFLLFKIGQQESGLQLLEEAFEQLVHLNQPVLLSNSRYDSALSQNNQLEKALKIFDRKEKILQNNSSSKVKINLNNSKAYLLAQESRYAEAVEFYESALKLCQESQVYVPIEGIQESIQRIQSKLQNHQPSSKESSQKNKSNDAPESISTHWSQKLLEILKDLNSQHHLPTLLNKLLAYTVNLTGASRGFLLMNETVNPSEENFKVQSTFNIEIEDEGELPISKTLLRKVFQSGEPLLTFNASEDEKYSALKSVARFDLKSILCVPIILKNKNIGAIYLDNPLEEGIFGNEQILLLANLAGQAALAIENTRLFENLEDHKQQLEEALKESSKKLDESQSELEATRNELNQGKQAWKTTHRYDYIIGQSKAMQEVLLQVDQVTDTLIPVNILGESGTGKELIARAIHYNSSRADQPFVTVNCGAIPENLAESEFFGYQRGAFTGANRTHKGYFEQANGGTLFLDEIADLPLNIQVKLLRTIQEGDLRRIGSDEMVQTDVRLVVASNKSLSYLVEQGEFREDLFYRLTGLTLNLPPLRERKEDIPLLANHIMQEMGKKYQIDPIPILDHSALDKLMTYQWPGNIRQLQHVLTNALIFKRSKTISAEDLQIPDAPRKIHQEGGPMLTHPIGDETTWEEYEKSFLKQLVDHFDGNKSVTARKLKIGRTTIVLKLK